MKSVFFILLGLLPALSSANDPQEQKVSAFYKTLIGSSDSILKIKNLHLTNDLNLQKTFEYEEEYRNYYAAQTGLPIDSAKDFTELQVKELHLENIHTHTLDLSYLKFDKVFIKKLLNDKFVFLSSIIFLLNVLFQKYNLIVH